MADERTYKMLLGAIAGGGSGGLPDYSEANDGDVLAIENGEPTWAAPGGRVLVANVDPQTYTLDKTWAEIDAAPFAVAKINDGTNNLTMPVLSTNSASSNSFKVFCFYLEAQSSVMVFEATSEDGYPVAQV